MSLVQYNGVYLPYSKQTSYKASAVYDEVSHTDRCLTKYEITVRCVVHLQYANAILPLQPDTFTDVMSLMREMQRLLEQPRKLLSYQVNGTEMMPTRAGVTGTVDALNGPQPSDCVFHELTSTSFMVSWSVIAHYVYNPDPTDLNDPAGTNRIGNPVIFHRWTETVEIDNCNYSTRTRKGMMKMRSDNVFGLTVDRLRSQMVVLSVPVGFIREKSSYTVTPDGLGLQYTITDKQQFRMPPSPAFTARGSYTETVPFGDAKRICAAEVALEGSQDTPLAVLIEAAVQIVSNKLNINGVFIAGINAPPPPFFNNDQRAVLDSFVIRIDMYKNNVMASLTGWTNIARRRLSGVPLTQRGLIDTPLTNQGYVPAYGDRGSEAAPLLLQAAAYWDPTLQGTQLGAGNILADDNPVRTLEDAKVQNTIGRQPGQAGRQPEA